MSKLGDQACAELVRIANERNESLDRRRGESLRSDTEVIYDLEAIEKEVPSLKGVKP